MHRSLCRETCWHGTPELDNVLKEVHPHYFNHPKNQNFIVLTQSCDLVIRRGECKTPYIVVAPVRGLDLVIERHLQSYKRSELNSALPIIGLNSKSKISEFLSRLINNNESNYFYLDANGELAVDSVAFLRLSIALKSELHYKTCLAAKILQLTEMFQAKLGWLVGQLYSRVGTQDWDAPTLNDKIAQLLEDVAIWVDNQKLRELKRNWKSEP